jgi:nucleotide-binding universal stress UspA family protein
MSLRKLLVPVTGVTDETPALSTAFAIAKNTDAHVEALFMAIDPNAEIAKGGYISYSVIEHVIRETEQENEKRRLRTKSVFDSLVREYAAPINSIPAKKGFSAAYVEAVGADHDLMTHQGRLCDLIVMEPPAIDGGKLTTGIEAALRESGRPLLLTRKPMHADFIRSVAIAWNGSVEVTRTIGFAMPLLEQASKVVVFTVEGDTQYGPTGSDLIGYLAWHGISAVPQLLPAGSHGQGEALLAAAKTHNVDLMMLGAFTRGELRRLVFGGVTGTMLSKSPFPLLMMH